MEQQTRSLIDFCGGDTEAKEDFAKRVNELGLDDKMTKLLYSSWTLGFCACQHIIVGAMRDKTIVVALPDAWGEPEVALTPISK